MPTENPFPLQMVPKVDSPELVAAMRQFGAENYADAEDFNEIRRALEWLYQNVGEEGGLTLFDVLKRGGRKIRTDFGTTEENHDYDLIKENRGEILFYINTNPAIKLDRLKLNAGQFDPGDTLEITIADNAVNDVILKTDDNTVLFSGENYLPGGQITLKIARFYKFILVGFDNDIEVWKDVSVLRPNLSQVLENGGREIKEIIDSEYILYAEDRSKTLSIQSDAETVIVLEPGVFPDASDLYFIPNGNLVYVVGAPGVSILENGVLSEGYVSFSNVAFLTKIKNGEDVWDFCENEVPEPTPIPDFDLQTVLGNGRTFIGTNGTIHLDDDGLLVENAFGYGLYRQRLIRVLNNVYGSGFDVEAVTSIPVATFHRNRISSPIVSKKLRIIPGVPGMTDETLTLPYESGTVASREWCMANLTSTVSGDRVGNIAARDAYDVPQVPFTIFVDNDGDGEWALYMATSIGIGATFVKISDPDLLNAEMSAAAIKTAYESNANTNAFTNAYKSAIDNLSTNFQAKGIYEEYFVFNTSPTPPVTGTTSRTIYYAEKIKAGTLKVGSQFTVEFQPLKTGNAGNSTLNFYVGNSSTDLTFSKIVGSLTRLQTNNNQPFARTYEVVSATKIRLMQWNNSSANDKNQAVSTWEDRDFDISIDQWIIATGTLTSGADTMFGNYITIKGVK